MKVLQLLVSWGSTWSVQTLTKKGSKNCVSYVRNDTTTYDINQGHSQVFQEKTDQNKGLNAHVQIVRILQAEEHQEQILFLFCIHLCEIFMEEYPHTGR